MQFKEDGFAPVNELNARLLSTQPSALLLEDIQKCKKELGLLTSAIEDAGQQFMQSFMVLTDLLALKVHLFGPLPSPPAL